MALRKHKYKQRLAEVEAWAKEQYAAIESSDAAKFPPTGHAAGYFQGRRELIETLLRKLTFDEVKEQALDESARQKRNLKRRRTKKAKDERDVWCPECLWTGPYKDAFYIPEQRMKCPNCGNCAMKFGKGPQDKAAS